MSREHRCDASTACVVLCVLECSVVCVCVCVYKGLQGAGEAEGSVTVSLCVVYL